MRRRSPEDVPAPAQSVSQEWFTSLFADKADPWDLATKWHDRRKFGVTVASLPRQRYRSGFEPGCANGELTRLLAPRCAALLAVDFVESAVEAASEATRDLPHVRVQHARLPEDLPAERFDLVVVSELLYYLSAADMAVLVDGLVDRLEPGGDLVAVHCRDDRRRVYDGANVHAALRRPRTLEPLVHYEDEAFVLDVSRRRSSVGPVRRWLGTRGGACSA
ncbi:methyltransferase domain-containing protein [Modestobacter sp. I12A-02628]|uniref:Methyltransferase domain-containing protein n=1 Tax=Goekera deserti TaxID=2497753 RepID=A0A7K3WD61_9ACTN|nr:methyltransferase domain-containing protein [Goekera deserti]NDI46765.1 methyltransferase domain-containing protein [Goekera deserti]NEL54334.1 methyltransferase domain-containing protein [Goekera deserti]